MRRHRISTAVLMLLVGGTAFAFALIRHALLHWGAGEVMTLALALLVFSILRAGFGRGRAGAFWTGFAVFGCSYMVLPLMPFVDGSPTSKFLDALYEKYASAFGVLDPGAWDEVRRPEPRFDRPSFYRAGHSFLASAFGLLGGVTSRALADREDRRPMEPDPPDGSLLNRAWKSLDEWGRWCSGIMSEGPDDGRSDR